MFAIASDPPWKPVLLLYGVLRLFSKATYLFGQRKSD
jgi:hypothetical protein